MMNRTLMPVAALWLIFTGVASAADKAVTAQEDRVLAVSNAGFEEGGRGWHLPPNATVVSDQAFSGKQSARLTVGDPGKEAVYITRQVPVVGGADYVARCRVKTSGVEKRAGKMPPVGAGLIVEWADKQGKWFASGVYLTGLFGDRDWTVREAKNLRAPEEAGFAVIYLTLRGAGTAWFDDFEFIQLTHSLVLESPPSGQTVHDNTPTLRWRDDPRPMRFTVEISSDPAFPTEKTTRLETEQPSVTLSRPIAPGRWHWRVTAPGYEPSAAWSFDQTAPLGQDTTAPAIAPEPIRVTRADEPARVRIREEGLPARPPTVQATLGGEAVPVRLVSVAAGEVDAVIAAKWQSGLNRVAINASDAAGNTETQHVLVLCRPAPARPVVIHEDGTYLEAGKRIFPLGIYQVLPRAMPKVKQAGFEVVHVYQFESSQHDGAARTYLDAAVDAGLRVFLGFDRGRSSGKGLVQGNAEHVIQRVAALCDHAGLFCWYLFDEPESPHQYVSPRTLIAYADLIRRLDPYHPVVVTTWGPRMALYRRSFDTHWTQAYTTPAGVVAQIQEHRRLLGPETPITLLAHCYDREQTERLRQGGRPDASRFQPDAAWLRAAAFAGVTQKLNGLWWWWYAEETKDYFTIAQVPEAWQALAEVVAQLKELEPVLIHPASAETGSVEVSGGKIHWWRKRVGSETTLIAVNTTVQEVRAAVPTGGAGSATVLFEGRQVGQQAGAITDDFPRYGVHVYRYGDEAK